MEESKRLLMKTVTVTASTLRVRSLPKVAPETDTGARIGAGQAVTAYGESFDRKWLYIKAGESAGWVSAEHVEEEEALTVRPWVKVPNGLAEIKATYGEPGNPRCQAGRVKLPASLPLSWDSSKRITIIACHELVAAPLQSAIDEIQRRDLWELLEDYGGCYNDRKKRGTSKRSTHAWGIGIDLNAKSNPLGAKPKMDSRIVAIFEERGFLWGGRWARKDGMHFQRCTGY